jgi:isoquinoline 1-oxidoreductase alpha subunit
MAISFKVNEQEVSVDLPAETPLLWAVRDIIGLTGTKYGCGVGACGACTVHVDGVAERACLITCGDVAGKAVVTIEGLDANGDHPVQKAWRELNVPQCGYCQAGQIMHAAAFLAANPRPSDAEITEAMAGNLCRCGCYQRIHAAVRAASTGV